MTITKHEVRAGAYYDSIVLMQLQKGLADLPEVQDAGVVMATPANLELLTASGFAVDDIHASPNDLLIVVQSDNPDAANAALEGVDNLLQRQRTAIPGSDGSSTFRPRSLDAATSQLPYANWVLISVPGRYAADVTRDALKLGKHIFLYSDNVSLQDEIQLKQEAQAKGLMVMGPDCGTAIINGIGFGFANRVQQGNIGVIGASGTGLQAVTSDIHNLGGGITQAIGTGGRDLKEEVGGITALQGLDLLAHDPATEVIVLISKPPAATVATKLLNTTQRLGKPVVVNFIGYPPPARQLGNLHFATSLYEAAQTAVSLSQSPTSQSTASNDAPPIQGYIRGLFSGGTLAYETMLGLQTVLDPLYSNAPIHPEQALADSFTSQAHTIIDLGEDEFTQGRLHPMMDNDLRLRRLEQEAAAPEVGLILLDVVLGEGSHMDPAAELAPAIAQAKAARPELEVAAIVVGTAEDPQDLAAQVEQLEVAGVQVFRTVNECVAYISQRVRQPAVETRPRIDLASFQQDVAAINVGLETFSQSLLTQGAEAIQVDWRPPAGGNEKLMAILAKMKK